MPATRAASIALPRCLGTRGDKRRGPPIVAESENGGTPRPRGNSISLGLCLVSAKTNLHSTRQRTCICPIATSTCAGWYDPMTPTPLLMSPSALLSSSSRHRAPASDTSRQGPCTCVKGQQCSVPCMPPSRTAAWGGVGLMLG